MSLNHILIIIAVGALAGVLKGVLGIAKDLVTKKDATVNWPWFWGTVLLSAAIGVVAAFFFSEDWRFALLSGYAGADFIEGLIKIKMRDKFSRVTEKQKSGFGELMKSSR